MSLFGGGHKSAAQTPTRAMGLDLQGAQYGAPIPVVFGRNKLAGNVIDYFEFQAIAHTQKQQGGKGGGGGGQTSTSYTYSVSYLLGLCEGVGTVVNVYDGSSARSLSSVGGLAFSGTQGQAPWSHLSGDRALGYSSTVLVGFQNKDLGSSASLPNYNFEIDGRSQFSASVKDANPGDIVTAICTDSQIGINFTALGDLTAFQTYCTAAGIFFSPVYDTQNPAQSTLEDLFKYANSAPFFSEGKLKVVPYGDETITGNGVTYTPDLTAVVDLGRDDFITNGTDDPVTVRRVAPADAMNIVRLEFKDRANTYHTSTVVASIDQDVVGTGSRADQSESVDMITSGDIARLVAQNLLQRTYYIRNTYEFQLSWRYCDLEPMDIVTLTDGNTGLYLTPVRITEITEDEHGLLQVTAEEFPEGVSHASIYATQPNAGTGVDPNADPGPITSPYLFRGPGFLVSNSQPEIWVAVSGVDPMWAGCDVYLSQDGTSYTYLTTHSRRAAYGELTNSLATGADPDTTGAPNVVLNGPVELLGGTQADADQFITLAMIDNEIVAYQTATLAGGPSYTLGYLRRGGYGSTQTSHAAGAPFVRLDENILRIPVDPSQIGQTVYLKFLSYNVFGKGGRTLADETAYTYVIGTNIELPDVPVTPASPAVTGVADGNSITWSNPNPAAVGCTSIEYATASGGPWTPLAQVGPTTTAYVHHFTTGATYYYRLRSRGPVVAAGWSAYTAVISGTGTNVGAISDNANTGKALASQVAVINPGFDAGDTGWTKESGWSIKSDGSFGFGQGYAEKTGGASDAALRNTAVCYVQEGKSYKVQALIKAIGANGQCYARISWRDLNNAEIGVTNGNLITGTTVAGSFAVGQAPTGAVFAHAEIAASSHTAGTYQVDNVISTLQPATADEIDESSGRKWAADSGATNGFNKGGNLLRNPTGMASFFGWDGGFVGSGQQTMTARPDAIPAGMAFACSVPASSSDQGASQFVRFSSGVSNTVFTVSGLFYTGHQLTGSHFIQIRQLDVNGNEISGATRPAIVAPIGVNAWQSMQATFTAAAGCYGFLVVMRCTGTGDGGQNRWAQLKLEIGSAATPWNYTSTSGDQLGVAGSGAKFGNQFNAPNSLTLNVGAVRSTTALSASSSGAVSVNAFTYYNGSASVQYNAVANAVTGLSPGTAYWIYCHDPKPSGGTVTWLATQNANVLQQTYDDIVVAGQITIPSSGTSSGGGSGDCVCDHLFVAEGRRAGDAREGDVFDCLDLPRLGLHKFQRVLHSVERRVVECVRLTTDGGAVWEGSASTPFDLLDGGLEWAPHMKGRQVVTDLGIETVTEVERLGPLPVSHLHLGGCSYAAGVDPTHRIYSHNPIMKK